MPLDDVTATGSSPHDPSASTLIQWVPPSGVLIDLAKRGLENSAAPGVIAVVMCAIGFEALVNEFLEQCIHSGANRGAVVAMAKEAVRADGRLFTRASLRGKLDTIARVLLDASLDWECEPLSDLTLLIQVRNALAHGRPEAFGDVANPIARESVLTNRLVERGLAVAPAESELKGFIHIAGEATVARWAYATIERCGHHLSGIFGRGTALANHLAYVFTLQRAFERSDAARPNTERGIPVTILARVDDAREPSGWKTITALPRGFDRTSSDYVAPREGEILPSVTLRAATITKGVPHSPATRSTPETDPHDGTA